MDSYDSPRRRLSVWLLLLAFAGAIIGFSWSERDYVAGAALAMMVACGLWGYFLGAVRVVGVLGALAAAYHYTPPTARWFAPQMAGWFNTAPGTTRLISWGLTALAIVIFVTLAAALLSRWLTRTRPHFEVGNHWLGFGMGATEGALVMLVLLGGVITAAPLAVERLQLPPHGNQDLLARSMAEHVVDIADQTRNSSVGPLIATYNPFDSMPPLKHVQRTLAVMNDPQLLAAITEHPVLSKLQEKPSVRAAMHSLANDPQLRELALSGKTIDSRTALSLLNNPTISKLLEQPQLIHDITEALGEIDSRLWDAIAAPDKRPHEPLSEE